MRTKLAIKFSSIALTTICVAFFVFNYVFAADGSGSATVSTNPTTTLVSSTGNILTFTFTAAESMNSGGISLTVPYGWSTPQGTSGVAGYTTVSTTGVVGSIFDEAEDVTNWVHSTSPSSCSGGLTIDTVTKHSGSGSLKCVNASDQNNGIWYYSTSTSMNWSQYTTIGFWIHTSSPINNGDLKFDYSTNTNLSSPLESLSLGTAITANTWTYVSFNFGSTTRSAIRSYGMHIANLSSMRNATVRIDSFSIGATASFVPSFSGRDIIVSAITLNSGDTITVKYGDGGGTSGAVASSTPGIGTFTLKSKTVDSGTLTAISSSPTVTVIDQTAPSVSLTAPTDGSTIHGASVSLAATASDNVVVAGVKFYIDGVLIGSEDTSSPFTGTLDSTAKSDGSHSIVAVARDSSNNYATSTASTVTIDNSAPILSPVTITSNNSSTTLAKVGDRVTLTFTANKTITTPTVTFTSGGVSASSSPTIINTSGNTWTASYITTSSQTSGTIGFSITAVDNFSNSSITTSLTSGANVVFDKTLPTLSSVMLSSNNASSTLSKAGDLISLSFSSSESISAPTVTFTSGGNAVTGGISITNPSGNNWLATYTANSSDTEGAVAYSVGFHDAAGNNGTTVSSGSGSVRFDKTNPTIVSLTTSASNPTGESPIPVAVTFSEAVTGLTSDDISVTNGSAGNLSGSGSSYTFDVTPNANGLVTISIGSGAVNDSAGNSNTDSAELTRTFSSLRPTVALDTDISSPTNDSTIHVTVLFSAAVSGFAADDLSLTNANTQNFSGSGSSYSFDLLPSSNGTVSVTVPAGSAVDSDTGANQNFASSPLTFVYDSLKPTLSEVTAVASSTTDITPTFTFSTDEGGTVTFGGGCTSNTTSASIGNNSVTFNELSEGTYNCTLTVTDAAGNTSLVLNLSSFTVDSSGPSITMGNVNPSASGVSIHWTTNEVGSSRIYYGLSSSYGSSTPESDIPVRITPHTVVIQDLVSCSTYHYKVSSTDASGNEGVSPDGTFTTRNCSGDADVSSQTSLDIEHGSGGSLSLLSSGRGLSLNVPANYGTLNASFQIKKINKTTAFDAIGGPADYQVVGDYVYDLHSLPYAGVAITSFSTPLSVTLNYSPSDISGIDEVSLKIFRYDGDSWTPLDNCSVNTSAHSVTCSTSNFSTFSIFGQEGSGGGSTPTENTASNSTPAQTSRSGTRRHTSGSTTYQFTRFLKVGSTGEDVRQLQIFLNERGFTVSKIGPGSSGSETEYFGRATKAALISFQEANSKEILIPQNLNSGTGNFFSWTMNFVNGLLRADQ